MQLDVSPSCPFKAFHTTVPTRFSTLHIQYMYILRSNVSCTIVGKLVKLVGNILAMSWNVIIASTCTCTCMCYTNSNCVH